MTEQTGLPYTSVFDAAQIGHDGQSVTDENILQVVGEGRIQTVAQAQAIFERLLLADKKSAENRAAVQAMFDGAPPYSESTRQSEGQSYLANFSSGIAKQALDSSKSAYIDMLQSVERLMDIKTNWGSPSERGKIEGILSEEWTRMMRGHPRYNFNFLNLSNFFLQHGVALAYFTTDDNWEYRTSGLGDFFIPRMTLSCEEELEVACCTRYYLPHELGDMVRGEHYDEHWNKDEVEKARIAALQGRQYSVGGPSSVNLQPEIIETQIKNNDWSLSYSTNTRIATVHFWVREIDGTVTHLISLRDGTNKDFLYKRERRFKSMSEAFTFFTYDIGNNGYYHSIRGLGHKIYAKTTAIDRLECSLYDNAMMRALQMVKPKDESSLQEAAITYVGQAAVLNPKFDVVETNFPNLNDGIMPVISEMKSMVQNDVGQYANPIMASDSTERTKFEWQTKVAESAKITSTSQVLFYEPLQKLFRNVIKRQIRPDYRANEPGGQYVWSWINRCVERGVPIEAIRQIDPERCKVMHALGAGSEAMRVMLYDQMMQMAGSLQPEQQRNFMRDWWAIRVGWENVDRYVPQIETSATTDEVSKVAILENNQMDMGLDIPVLPAEPHSIHAPIHIQKVQEMQQAIESDESLLERLFAPFMLLLEHSTQTVEYLANDPFYAKKAAEWRRVLQNANEIAYNGSEKLRRAQEQAAQEAADQGQNPPQAPYDPNVQAKIEENRLKLQQMQEEHQQKMAQRDAEFKQRMSMADAKEAQRVMAA